VDEDVAVQTRGFLFSDLRGYSAFVERHGDGAARELLARYRRIVREAVGRHDGAEVRTEGDSFYVVFESVSHAVEAGLAIQADLAADGGGEPIRAGIGIHAGEVVDDAEHGIISGAVNIAARVCGIAGPGEVLVTDTVRALTRNYLTATFAPRGRRRLKGITDPVAVYAVLPADAGLRHRRARMLLGPRSVVGFSVIGTVLVASIILAATILNGGVPTDGRASSAGPSPVTPSSSIALPPSASTTSVTSVDLGDADEIFGFTRPLELARGTYAFADFQPTLLFSVHTEGWYAYVDDVDAAGLLLDDPGSPPGLSPIGGVMFGSVQVVYNDPCDLTDTTVLDSTPKAFIEWLQRHESLSVSSARPVSLGGYSGLEVDVAFAGTACNGASRIDLYPVAQNRFGLHEDDRLRVMTLNLPGRPVSVMVQASSEADEEVTSEIEDVVETIEIDAS
jgi:class 3 adenylate cyclase